MTMAPLPPQAQYGLTPQQMQQQQYMQQQTRQLQMQQQGYLLQQQRQQAEQAGYGAGGYRGPSAASAADNALARRLQEEEMAGEEQHQVEGQAEYDAAQSMEARARQCLDSLGRQRKAPSQMQFFGRLPATHQHISQAPQADRRAGDGGGGADVCRGTRCWELRDGARTRTLLLIAGARPRRQAANQASKRFTSYSSDEDSDTSAETVPSEEEDSDDSNAGGKKKSKAAKARAVRHRADVRYH